MEGRGRLRNGLGRPSRISRPRHCVGGGPAGDRAGSGGGSPIRHPRIPSRGQRALQRNLPPGWFRSARRNRLRVSEGPLDALQRLANEPRPIDLSRRAKTGCAGSLDFGRRSSVLGRHGVAPDWHAGPAAQQLSGSCGLDRLRVCSRHRPGTCDRSWCFPGEQPRLPARLLQRIHEWRPQRKLPIPPTFAVVSS